MLDNSIVSSTPLEIASYLPPVTTGPNYVDYFNDLHSKQIRFNSKSIVPNSIEGGVHSYLLAFGSEIQWKFEGGTNYWADDIYELRQGSETKIEVKQVQT